MEKVPFYREDLDRTSQNQSTESLSEVLSLFDDPRLEQEILAGNITLAMVRPNVGPEANNLDLPDVEAAGRIEEMIEDLGVLAKFSFNFTTETTEEFYGGGPQESMSKEAPREPGKYDSRWPEFVDFMTSGPTTVILLHSPNGDAIQRWRSHLGHWNIDEVRDESTIRGKLGVNKYNNLVHGSDAPESVLREISLIRSCVESVITDSDI